jgi:hypothetical protein
LFARDEYQGGAGNLPHIHAIIRVNYDANDPHTVDAFLDRIRGFVGDILRVEEIDDYVAEGLLRDRDEWYEIQKLAGSILMHRSERNMKRVGTADRDVVMRDNNQFYKNPDPTKYSTVVIDPHTENAIKVLGQCGLAASPPEYYRRKLVDCHPLLECKHQYPPMKRGDSNMSPVIPCLFVGMPSMMNAQEVTGYSLMQYVTKYIADMDKNTQTMFNANIHDPKLIKMETKFLYNTKITSSVIGADKRFERCGTRITLREGSF